MAGMAPTEEESQNSESHATHGLAACVTGGAPSSTEGRQAALREGGGEVTLPVTVDGLDV